jgi:hypothetical protein
VRNLREIDCFRIRDPRFSWMGDETCGAFVLPNPVQPGLNLRVIASDGEGWDHVSVSTARRIPNWREMCHVKGLFFEAEEAVMQLHPPESTYVNNHPYCLHLWRPHAQPIPLPPTILVGVKALGELPLKLTAEQVEMIDKVVAEARR